MMAWTRGLAALALVALLLGAPSANAQPGAAAPDPDTQLRQQVEMWVRAGQRDRAIEILENRQEQGELSDSLWSRLASLYRESGRHADLERAILERNPDPADLDVGEMRLLAEARFRLGKEEQAREILDRIVERHPGDESMTRLVANILSQSGHADEAIELLRETRRQGDDPLLFAQLLARLLSGEGEKVEAVREYARMVVANPLNVSLVRGRILQEAESSTEEIEAMRAAVDEVRERHPGIAQLSLVAAELRLRAGDEDAAWRALEPHMSEPTMIQELLRLSLAGLADSRSASGDPERAMRRLEFSARIAKGLLDAGQVPRSLQPRTWDTLTRSLMALMENEAFLRESPEEQLEVLETTRSAIGTMRREFAGNRMTASAMLRLAELYAFTLGRAEVAIEIYTNLAQDPNAPQQQIKAARLGLARSHIAAGDTSTARSLFDEIGQDMDFVEGQGRAQYHLGQLDFMGGHFTTAEDRLKAVAMEAPRADYTNDALDLALVLAEEMMSGAADTLALRDYGRMLYHRAVSQPDSVRYYLETVAGEAVGPLRARSHLDLARFLRRHDGDEAALLRIEELLAADPTSRYVPVAVELKGQVLESLGRDDEAMAAYETLLLEHESYVHLDRVRDRIRALRGEGTASTTEEELP